MKTTILYLTLLVFVSPIIGQLHEEQHLTPNSLNPSLLIGNWRIDLSPENNNDDNFAKMIICSVEENSIEGYFYRDGVKIKEGRITNSQGVIYVALVSGDNSGTYNTAFHLKDGMLYGTTHSLDKDFLAVWKAIKLNQ